MTQFSGISRRDLLAAGGAGALMLALGGPVLAQGGKLPIGIIGSGNIGGAIGALWVKAGHPVMFSSRDPSELTDMVAALGPLAKAGTVAQSIAFGTVVFIAVPYAALPQIGTDYRDALKGKVVMDACNAVASRDGDAITKEVDTNGIGVTSQKYLPSARVVRAFNTMGSGVFTKEANRPDPKLAIPVGGDDADAVRVASGLVRDAGFEPVVTSLADANKYQQRIGPSYGFQGSADQLRTKLQEPAGAKP